MLPAILSIGVANPEFCFSQADLASQIKRAMNLDDEGARVLEKIFDGSAIANRYSVLPNIMQGSMGDRNAIYKKEAPKLAEKAALKALEEWGGARSRITHVVSVSCTGAITPGIEFILADRLGLDPYVSLLGINFMGCHGAFKGLKVARKIALENPEHRVLLVCTELCSLHFKPRGDIESIVIQSLFADGSAAVVIGQDKGIFTLDKEQSFAIRNTMKEMTWDAGSDGFDMTLSRKVPKLIGDHIEPFSKRLLGELSFDLCEWAIHPGGKGIVEAVEKALKLDPDSTESTWKVLREIGNVSSGTFLFVLDAVRQKKSEKKKVVGLGFGPGLSVEGVLLTTC